VSRFTDWLERLLGDPGNRLRYARERAMAQVAEERAALKPDGLKPCDRTDSERLDWLATQPYPVVFKVTEGWRAYIAHSSVYDAPTIREAIDALIDSAMD
jgi:hypothetical protein